MDDTQEAINRRTDIVIQVCLATEHPTSALLAVECMTDQWESEERMEFMKFVDLNRIARQVEQCTYGRLQDTPRKQENASESVRKSCEEAMAKVATRQEGITRRTHAVIWSCLRRGNPEHALYAIECMADYMETADAHKLLSVIEIEGITALGLKLLKFQESRHE